MTSYQVWLGLINWVLTGAVITRTNTVLITKAAAGRGRRSNDRIPTSSVHTHSALG